jgi:hypothetical protein
LNNTFAVRDTIELVEAVLLEAFTDAICLWALGLGARVIDVLDREIQLVFMPFTSGAATWPLAARAQPAA